MPILVACPACSQQLRVSDALIGKKVRCSACKGIFEATAQSEEPAADDLPLERVSDSSDAPEPARGVAGIKLSLDDDPPPTPAKSGSSKAIRKKSDGKAEESEKEANGDEEKPRERRPKLSRFSADLLDCPKCGAQVHKDLDNCNRCGARMGSAKKDEDEDEQEEAKSRSSRRSRRRRRDDDDDDDDAPRRGPVRRDCEPHRGVLILILGIVSLVLVGVQAGICLPLPLITGLISWIMGGSDLRKMNAGQMDPEGRGMTLAGYICGIIGTALSTLILLLCAAYFAFVIVMVGAASNSGPGGPMPPPRPIVRPGPGR
jgi:predicted Zn finger-like uncharacterized protein